MYRTCLTTTMTLTVLTVSCLLNSCETLPLEPPAPEPSVAERQQTERKIAHERRRLDREAEAARERAEELDTASRMMGRGAAN